MKIAGYTHNEALKLMLAGLECRQTELQVKISEVKSQLGSATYRQTDTKTPAKPTRQISAAARANIVAAQKKRWATVRAAKAKTAKTHGAKAQPIAKTSRRRIDLVSAATA